ncbi:MAG: glycosyltransferase family 39 protein [Desulfuromonadales bacterium]|jgi:4-amino-4-deoxy-L-arabinose transferase-like glycosyltransferase
MPESPDKRRLWALLLAYVFLLLLPAGLMPLMESTEGRYGEIAWEMVVRGNYLEPYFNGIKHFHKPPLTYWSVAAGYQLFGIGNFGARFFGVLAAGLAVLYLFRLAQLFLPAGRALQAALIFATSILFLAVARIVATDIYLTCFTVMAQFYLFRRLYGQGRRSDAPLFGLALGLGFLAKGPIIFLFTLLPFFLAKTFDRSHRRVFSWRETALGTVVFAVVALPWYLAVMIKNPGLLHYFVKVQTVDRVASNHFGRSEPLWFFVYVFPATFLPWIFFFLRGVGGLQKLVRRQRLLLLYLLAPLVVFTLAQSKQPTYILPFYGVAAVFTAAALEHFAMPRLRTLAVLLLLPVALAPAVSGFVYPPVHDLRWWLVLTALPGLWLAGRALRARHGPGLVPWAAAVLLFFATVGYGLASIAAPQMRGYEQMAAAIDRLDPQRQEDLLVYRDFLPSLSLYRHRLAASAYGMEREPLFQDDDSYREYYLPTGAALQSYLALRPKLFVVLREHSRDDFEKESGYHCTTVYKQRKHTALHCRRNAGG